MVVNVLMKEMNIHKYTYKHVAKRRFRMRKVYFYCAVDVGIPERLQANNL